MKLGFVGAILPDLSFDEVIHLAAAEGYSCVELMCWPKGGAGNFFRNSSYQNKGASF